MKKIFILILLILTSFFGINIYAENTANIVKKNNNYNILKISYRDRKYIIDTDFNFFKINDSFEEYQAYIIDEKDIIYMSISKYYAMQDKYILNVFYKTFNEVLHITKIYDNLAAFNIITSPANDIILAKLSDDRCQMRNVYLDSSIDLIEIPLDDYCNKSNVNNNDVMYNSSSEDIQSILSQAKMMANNNQNLNLYNPYEMSFDSDTHLYCQSNIIALIPEGLFYFNCNLSVIGQEYGYFINTITLSPGCYSSDVVLFDIIYDELLSYDTPAENSVDYCDFKVSIKPLFSFTYRAFDKAFSNMSDYNWNTMFGSNVEKIIVSQYDVDNYKLADIKFSLFLNNYNELNPGDNGYSPINDKGDYINNANLSGEIKRINNNSNVSLQLINLGVGCLGNVGAFVSDTISFFDIVSNANSNSNNKSNPQPIETNFNYPDTKQNQINDYGGLVKAATLFFSSDSNNNNLVPVNYNIPTNGTSIITAKFGVNASNNLRELISNEYNWSLGLKLCYNSYENVINESEETFYMGVYRRGHSKISMNTMYSVNSFHGADKGFIFKTTLGSSQNFRLIVECTIPLNIDIVAMDGTIITSLTMSAFSYTSEKINLLRGEYSIYFYCPHQSNNVPFKFKINYVSPFLE